MDRGMASAENIAWLQRTGRRYLIGTPKSELRQWAREIAEVKDWQAVRDGVEAKLCAGPAGTETFVLCRSIERREEGKAMHARLTQGVETGPHTPAAPGARARPLVDPRPPGRQTGPLPARHT